MKKIFLILTSCVYITASSWAQNFEFIPEQSYIVKSNKPKNNIHAMFDDSASIASEDIYVSEHFFGQGQPICTKPSNWNTILDSPRYKNGNYYNPFFSGTYIPYDPINKHHGYDGSVFVEQCTSINRGEAFANLLKNFLSHFQKEYFLGFGGVGKNNTAAYAWYTYYGQEYPLIIQEITNLSDLSPVRWQEMHKQINKAFEFNAMRNSWSPILPAIYNIGLYYRNFPIPKINLDTQRGYVYQEYSTPLKYRCAHNNILLFTDGRPNRSYVDVFARSDVNANSSVVFAKQLKTAETRTWNSSNVLVPIKSYQTMLTSDLLDAYYYNFIEHLAYIEDGYTGSEDGKTYTEPNAGLDDNRYEKAKYHISAPLFQRIMSQDLLAAYNGTAPKVDSTGNSWTDSRGIQQELTMNAIMFSKDPTQQMVDLLHAMNGNYISQTSIDLNTLFHNITILLENSKTLTTYTNGHTIEDQYMRTKDTIRYVFDHNIYTNTSNIKAFTLGKSNRAWKAAPEWTSQERLHPFDGKFVTMAYTSAKDLKDGPLTRNNIDRVFKLANTKRDFTLDHLNWLYGLTNLNTDIGLTLRARHSPLGPIVNGKPVFFAKDREYINLNLMSKDQKALFEEYIDKKSQLLNKELLITGANDGLIHFITTERKDELSNDNAGMRKAAYFPGFLATRLFDITENAYPFSFTMDGSTDIFEFKNKQGDFQTIGLTGMGAGGKGLVGYQIFKLSKNGNIVDQNITPLFEINNIDNFEFKTPNFQNLGYTYSGFEFFNQGLAADGSTGQGVAVFGNGYGPNKSSLYLIDVENGSLIREIELHPLGGGAATPALVLQEGATGLHQLRYIVVGDQSGRLYLIYINGSDPATAPINTRVIYEPTKLFDHPISTKPLLYSPSNTTATWVYFGTGRKADPNLDRGDKSKKQQYFIAAPIGDSIDLAKLTEVQYDIGRNDIVKLDSNNEEGTNGWYLQLSYNSSRPSGNRIAYEPSVTKFDDIVFSTWSLEEGSDFDLCADDIGSGQQFALDAKTGKIGKFYSNNQNVAGVNHNQTAPGIPSGTTLTSKGYLTGSLDHGSVSTLSQEFIDQLNKNNKITSHGESSKFLEQCLATTNGELNIPLIEFCHNLTRKQLTKKRISIQSKFSK